MELCSRAPKVIAPWVERHLGYPNISPFLSHCFCRVCDVFWISSYCRFPIFELDMAHPFFIENWGFESCVQCNKLLAHYQDQCGVLWKYLKFPKIDQNFLIIFCLENEKKIWFWRLIDRDQSIWPKKVVRMLVSFDMITIGSIECIL